MRERMHQKERHSEWVIAVFCIAVLGILLLFNVLIFRNSRDSLLKLQEENMLATAKTVANSLQNFYDRELEELTLYFNEDAEKERIERYCEDQDTISYVAVLNQQGQIWFSYGTDYDSYMEAEFSDYWVYEKEGDGTYHARLLPAVLTGKNHYTQFLVSPAAIEGERGWVVAAIEMDLVYERIVKPVQIGDHGYSMVKRLDGTILMHATKNQIGLDAIEGRKKKYKDYDLEYEDLEKWLVRQREEPEGSGLLNSYWWEEQGEPQKSTKVISYIQRKIGEEIWIINCTLNYEELLEPIRKAQNYVTAGASLLLLASAGVLAVSFQNVGNRRIMELEVKHLTEMNSAWEELHKREEQIRHIDKIQTLGTMTSMISHEFNNFLTPIMLYGDILEADETISEENKVLIREMITSATKAKDLTKELSRYGHSGKGSGKKVVLHIVDEVERSLKLLKKTVPSNIVLEQALEADTGYGMMGSAGMVNQIIVNLCNNAVQAIKEQNGHIMVKGSMLMDGDAMKYAITVSDDGPGMSQEIQKQIFTPFFTTKKQGEGTGLGLSVVQDLIYEVSGEINMVSVEGKGTRFDILFPVFQIPEEEKRICDLKAFAQYSVLILDDDERVGDALGRTLKKHCKKIKVLSRPEAALSEMKKHIDQWDLVLTDYTMQVMNGLEFSGILRSLGYRGKIFLISGNLSQDVLWYQDNGIIDCVLEKPVTLTEIEHALNEEKKREKSENEPNFLNKNLTNLKNF